jgi:hypothetical protein
MDVKTVIVLWTASAGLVGVVVGAILTALFAARRERKQRQLAFVEKQLSEFYSPMCALRAEVRAFSNLRVKLHDAAEQVWRELCESVEPGPQAQALSAARFPQFKALIEHDNTQFEARIMPA